MGIILAYFCWQFELRIARMGRSSFGRLFTANSYNRNSSVKLGTSVTEGRPETSRDGPYRLPEVPGKL